jgi:glycerate 2-kinase
LSEELRSHARAILAAGVAAVDPDRCVRNSLRLLRGGVRLGSHRIAMKGGARVHLLAAGKAAAGMSVAAAAILEARLGEVSVVVPHGAPRPVVAGQEAWSAGHPFSDAGSLAAAADALRVARTAAEGDLVLCLLSGGASALWGAPRPGLTLGDLHRTAEALMAAGVEIEALNAVRRRLTVLGGGGLAAASRGRIATLAISDVVGSAPEAIGSGPTVREPVSPADALAAARRGGSGVPARVLDFLSRQTADDGPLWAVEGPAAPFVVIAQGRDAEMGAETEARSLGYTVERWPEPLRGEARHAGRALAARLTASSGETPRALIASGETTVTVSGGGRGGRNQELALAAALALEGAAGVVLGAMGTDGIDGPTDAAGAVVDGGTGARAREAGMDPEAHLRRNDSHPLLRATGDLVVSGPTGTNVGDLVVGLASPDRA